MTSWKPRWLKTYQGPAISRAVLPYTLLSRKLFVYGTLRKGASAAHLMKNAFLERENVPLKGFTMQNKGPYPLVITGSFSDLIIGDIFRVTPTLLTRLDRYEGPEYFRQKVRSLDCWIYLARNRLYALSYPTLPGGDWLLKNQR